MYILYVWKDETQPWRVPKICLNLVVLYLFVGCQCHVLESCFGCCCSFKAGTLLLVGKQGSDVMDASFKSLWQLKTEQVETSGHNFTPHLTKKNAEKVKA